MIAELTPTQYGFRTAMANLSAAVNIVTTAGIAGRAGITVSAVCSVTDTPPTLLVCINQGSYTHDIFRTNRRIAVNVLSAELQPMALHFSGQTKMPMDERFALPEWDHASYDVPVLHGAAATLVGTIGAEYSQGTHTVLFVHVEDVTTRPDADGLVYFRRGFHDLTAKSA